MSWKESIQGDIMENQNQNQNNQENTSFNDQADGKFDKAVKNAQGAGGTTEKDKLSKGVSTDDDENAGGVYSENLMSKSDKEVRENENASLQDDSYSFDEANTDNEEYHDADAADDMDFDNDDDFVQ
jgi:hypothetical protein